MIKQFNNNTTSLATLLIAVVIIFSSCGSEGTEEMPGGSPQPTDFIQLKPAQADTKNSYPATIEGAVNVDIKAQVTGYLEAIYVNEGDYVQKGKPLFKIKSDVFNQQVNNSRAALDAAVATQANAKLEVEKLKPLVAGKVITEMQLKTAQANYEAATAQVEQARAALGSSKINAAFATISAPVSGYIGRIPNRTGNLVSPGDATPLTTLSDINNVFAYFSLPESEFLTIRKSELTKGNQQQSIELQMADGSIYNHKGKLEVASGNLDRATGTISMKAIFSNPDKLLRAGGAARIIVHHTMDQVIAIPMGSVKDIQDKYFVFKLTDSNKVAMTAIEITGNSNNQYLIKSGLQTGDKVAANRIDALYDGMQVAPAIISLDSLSK